VLLEITGVVKQLRGRWKATATSAWDGVRDNGGDEGGGGALYTSGADPRLVVQKPRSLGETVERSTWNSPHRAKLEDRSATELVNRAFPVSRFCPHLSHLLFCFPQRGVRDTGSSVGSTFPPGKLD